MAWAEALRALSLAGVLALAALGLLERRARRARLPRRLRHRRVQRHGAFAGAVPGVVDALAAANARIELARRSRSGARRSPARWRLARRRVAFGVARPCRRVAVILLSGVREPARPRVRRATPRRRPRGRAIHVPPSAAAPDFVTQFVFNTAFFVLQAVFVPMRCAASASPRPASA